MHTTNFRLVISAQLPLCDNDGNDLRRKRRSIDDDGGPKADYRINDPIFAQNATTVEVFGGFYVTDTTDNRDTRLFDDVVDNEVSISTFLFATCGRERSP